MQTIDVELLHCQQRVIEFAVSVMRHAAGANPSELRNTLPCLFQNNGPLSDLSDVEIMQLQCILQLSLVESSYLVTIDQYQFVDHEIVSRRGHD